MSWKSGPKSGEGWDIVIVFIYPSMKGQRYLIKSGEVWDIIIVFIHPKGQEYFTKYCAFELCIPISPSDII